MNVDEVYYLGAANGYDHVYYRVRVKGRTQLGVAEFREGWYPARAVDALFGDISMEGMAEQLDVEEKLRGQIDTALLKAHQDYLEEALSGDADEDDLSDRLDAIAQVRHLPSRDRALIGESVVVEYDPSENLVTTHNGNKLVIVLSSNPDEIIGKLTDLVEDAQTEKLFTQLSDVVVAREEKRSSSVRARELVGRDLNRTLTCVLDDLSTDLETDDISRDALLGELDAIISFLRGAQQ